MARGSSLSGLSVRELEAELQRRSSKVGALQRKRDRLMAKVAELDKMILSQGGRPGRGSGVTGRVRPTNSMTLVEALQGTLKGKQMSVTETAAAVQKNGYNTNAENFRTIVNQTLIKFPRLFKRVERGQYTAV